MIMPLVNKLESFEPAKKVGGLLEEFKAFAFKGSMIDLAIGVIIGAAFGTIVKSLVDNIVMPLVSLAIPNATSYENLKWILSTQTVDGKQVEKAVYYGKFLADLLNFVIVAFVVFIFLKKLMGWLMHAKQQEAATASPPLSKDQQLLTEIRDLLKQRST
ncbi:MAG TPA: large conductance mechanosensitive channel protein MscL [Pirellulales bacterium]|jgi:large conductance mechanosensitive channel|nr:large conductance mechanosensitive channel protein MscL [Pirellulales bacterium]